MRPAPLTLGQPAREPIAWDRVDTLSRELAAGNAVPLATLFRDRSAPEPRVTRAPDVDGRLPERVALVWRWWTALASRGMPSPDEINPAAILPALPDVALLEPVGDGDFRYRVYGSGLAMLAGTDLTWQRVSDHPASGHVVELLLAVYRSVRATGIPMLVVRSPAAAERVASWTSLTVPFGTKDGGIDRLLVVAVATGRSGRPIHM